LDEAGDPELRANPANGIKDIYKYLEVSLAEKRSLSLVGDILHSPGSHLIFFFLDINSISYEESRFMHPKIRVK